MKTYTIRPLEWKPRTGWDDGAEMASCPGGAYIVGENGWLFDDPTKLVAAWKNVDSLEAAKAACQADFEERLAQWLEEATP